MISKNNDISIKTPGFSLNNRFLKIPSQLKFGKKKAEKNESKYTFLLYFGSHYNDDRDANNSDIEFKIGTSHRFFLVFTLKYTEAIYLY